MSGATNGVRSWREWTAREAGEIRARGQWRAPVDFDAHGTEGKLVADGRAVVSFASNDYLGLTQHPAVIGAAHAALERWGTGSGAARLIVGSRPVHSELEAALADWKHAERAVLFSTGYAANLGVLTTFTGPDVLVCSDELNHASIIDGRRLSGAQLAVYRHADAAHVDQLLSATTATRAVVVSESVFSMDGDVAPIDDLIDVCARRGALLVLDEAHAVLGPDPDPIDRDVLRVGTLSKTLGALGGFVAGPAVFMDLLVNRARSYIFTTASTPADTAAALAALTVLRSEEGDARRARLRNHVQRLRPGHPSPIVPYLCGDERAALDAAAALLDEGFLVTAIRPPTVPAGTSRLRVTVSASHTDDQVDRLARAGEPVSVTDGAPTDRGGRPACLAFVTGTGTEIGKTWWTTEIARALGAGGSTVSVRKPVQSCEPGAISDAEILAAATGEPVDTVTPPHRTYRVAWAPPMAADHLGRPPFRVVDLVEELVWPAPVAVGLVEGVGGPRSPLASDGDNVALIELLEPDVVVLVADAGLGTVNAVRLAAAVLATQRLVVALNRYDGSELHARNRATLESDGLTVVTAPTELLPMIRPSAP